jgi:hypothetical protein
MDLFVEIGTGNRLDVLGNSVRLRRVIWTLVFS